MPNQAPSNQINTGMNRTISGGPDDIGKCKEILEMSPEERKRREISPEDVTVALKTLIQYGTAEEKHISAVALPPISLSYSVLKGEDRSPLIFEDCSFEGINMDSAEVWIPIRFTNCSIGNLTMDEATFHKNAIFDRSRFIGAVSGFEAAFKRDASFTNVDFVDAIDFTEADFGEDARFNRVIFNDIADFKGSRFEGTSNLLSDNASFEESRFREEADFTHGGFEHASFDRATFEEGVCFEETTFDGDVNFTKVDVHEHADFDEVTIKGDADFTETIFHTNAVFRGAEFLGGARHLHDDVCFEGVEFTDGVDFQTALFRSVNFEEAHFDGSCNFTASEYQSEAAFIGAQFETTTSFDDARFDGDADFSECHFHGDALFRGAEFTGEYNHLKEDVSFDDAVFTSDASFDNASLSSATFNHTEFGGTISFKDVRFSDKVHFSPTSIEDTTYVNLTSATLPEGTIQQPPSGWVRYDLTHATVGDVTLGIESGEPSDDYQLLDYFRFCRTKFEDFDFTEHAEYFDRNNWSLHTFDETNAEYEYEETFTPRTIELTYLNAQNAADAIGYGKAFREFRILRQRYNRMHDENLLLDRSANISIKDRFQLCGSIATNYFMDKTCCFGGRLSRIIALVFLFPLPFGITFGLLGGPFKTSVGHINGIGHLLSSKGIGMMWDNVYFTYVTYTTVGYGADSPIGIIARISGTFLALMGVVLGSLLVYTLHENVKD